MYTSNAPLITVILTAYNRRRYLEEAINSTLNQTLSKEFYEVIVIKNFE
jgi:glycosyltransferase involved in cell wall biosynthesis